METIVNKEAVGHLGVITAPRKRRRSHIKSLSSQQKAEILATYKQYYQEYQRKLEKA